MKKPKSCLRTINALLILLLLSHTVCSQNDPLGKLLGPAQWDSLFPRRAGTFGTHPQGYQTDFYSYEHLKRAIREMSDFRVRIMFKKAVWGQWITVTKKSSQTTYNYSDVEAWWHANPTPETVMDVDFEDFIHRNSDQNNKRELAAFLAHISKETTGGWQLPVGGGAEGDYAKWGLYFVHELGYNSSNGAGAYSQAHPEFPPNPAVGYYGRGPIQLSWNYNYGQLSKFLYQDKNVLLDNPDLIQQDGVLAFKSALWFWMMPQCPKPSCHQVMHELWNPEPGEYASDKMYQKGFAHTNNIINGGLECRTTSSAGFTQKVVLRSELYQYYLGLLGFSKSQISSENSNGYSTLCFEAGKGAMQDYLNCHPDLTSGHESPAGLHLRIYPNPARQWINLECNNSINKAEIVNATGQVVRTYQLQSGQIQLDVSGLPCGAYLVRIYSENGVLQDKLGIAPN